MFFNQTLRRKRSIRRANDGIKLNCDLQQLCASLGGCTLYFIATFSSTYYDLNDDDFRGKGRLKSHRTRLKVKENLKNTTILRPDNKSGMKAYSLVILPGYKATGKQSHRDAGDGVKTHESRIAWGGAVSESDRSCTAFHSVTALGQTRPQKSPSNDSEQSYYQSNSGGCLADQPNHASHVSTSMDQDAKRKESRPLRQGTETHKSSKRYRRSKSNEVRKDVRGSVTQTNAEDGSKLANSGTSAPISRHQHSNQRRSLRHGKTRLKSNDENDHNPSRDSDKTGTRRPNGVNLDNSSGDVRTQTASSDRIRLFLDIPKSSLVNSANASSEKTAHASVNGVASRAAEEPYERQSIGFSSKAKEAVSKRRRHQGGRQNQSAASRSGHKENTGSQDVHLRHSHDAHSGSRPSQDVAQSQKGLVTKIMRRDLRNTQLFNHDVEGVELEPVKRSQRYRFLTSDGMKESSEVQRKSSQGGVRLSSSPGAVNLRPLSTAPKSDSPTKCVSGHLISPLTSDPKDANVGGDQETVTNVAETRSINVYRNALDDHAGTQLTEPTDSRNVTNWKKTESGVEDTVRRKKSAKAKTAAYSEKTQNSFNDGHELARKSGEKQSSRILLAMSSGQLRGSLQEATDQNEANSKHREMNTSEIHLGLEDSASLFMVPEVAQNKNGKPPSSDAKEGSSAVPHAWKDRLVVETSKYDIVTLGSSSRLLSQQSDSAALDKQRSVVYKPSINGPKMASSYPTLKTSGDRVSLSEKKEYPAEFDPLVIAGGAVHPNEAGYKSLRIVEKDSQTLNADGRNNDRPSRYSARLSLINPRSSKEDVLEGSSASLLEGKVFYLTEDVHLSDGSLYRIPSGIPDDVAVILEYDKDENKYRETSKSQEDPNHTVETYDINPQATRSDAGRVPASSRSSNVLHSDHKPAVKHSRGTETSLTLKGSSEGSLYNRAQDHVDQELLPLRQPSGSTRPSTGEGHGGIEKERSHLGISLHDSQLGELARVRSHLKEISRESSQLADISHQSSQLVDAIPRQRSQLVLRNGDISQPGQDYVNSMPNETQMTRSTETGYSNVDRDVKVSKRPGSSTQLSRSVQGVGHTKQRGDEKFTQEISGFESRATSPVYNRESAWSIPRLISDSNNYLDSEDRKYVYKFDKEKVNPLRGTREKMMERVFPNKGDQSYASDSVGASYKPSKWVNGSEMNNQMYKDELRASRQSKIYKISADESLLASETGKSRREKLGSSRSVRASHEPRLRRKSREENPLERSRSRTVATLNRGMDKGAVTEYPATNIHKKSTHVGALWSTTEIDDGAVLGSQAMPQDYKNSTSSGSRETKVYSTVVDEVDYSQALHLSESDLNCIRRRTVRFSGDLDRKSKAASRRHSGKSRHTSDVRTTLSTRNPVDYDASERRCRSGGGTRARWDSSREGEQRGHSTSRTSDMEIVPMSKYIVDSDDKARYARNSFHEKESRRHLRSHTKETGIDPISDYIVGDEERIARDSSRVTDPRRNSRNYTSDTEIVPRPEYEVDIEDDRKSNAWHSFRSSERLDSRSQRLLSSSSADPRLHRRSSSADLGRTSTRNHIDKAHSQGKIHNILNLTVERLRSKREDHFTDDVGDSSKHQKRHPNDTVMSTQGARKYSTEKERALSNQVYFRTVGSGSDRPRRTSSNKSTKSTDKEMGRSHGLKVDDDTHRKKHLYYRESSTASPVMHKVSEKEVPNIQDESQLMGPLLYGKDEATSPDTARLTKVVEGVKFEPIYNEREQNQQQYVDSTVHEPRYEEQTYSAAPANVPGYKDPQRREPRLKETVRNEIPSGLQPSKGPPNNGLYNKRAYNEYRNNQSPYSETRFENFQYNKTPHTKPSSNETFFNVDSYIQPVYKDSRFCKPPLKESNSRIKCDRKPSPQSYICRAKIPFCGDDAQELSETSKYKIRSKKSGDHFWKSLTDLPEKLQFTHRSGGLMQSMRCQKSDILKRPLVSSPVLRGVSSRLRCNYKSPAHVYRDTSREATHCYSKRTPSSSELLRVFDCNPTEYRSSPFFRVSAKYISPVGAKKSKGRKYKNVFAESEEKRSSFESFTGRSEAGYDDWDVEPKTMDCQTVYRTDGRTEGNSTACSTAAFIGSGNKEIPPNVNRRPTGAHDERGFAEASSRKQSTWSQLEYNPTQESDRWSAGPDAHGNTYPPPGKMVDGSNPNIGVSESASKVKFVVPHSEEGFAQTYGADSESGSKTRLNENLLKQISKDDLRQPPLHDIGRPPSPRRYSQQGTTSADYLNTPMNSRQSPSELWRTPSRDRQYGNYAPSYDVGVGRSASRDRQFGVYSQTSADRFGSPVGSRQNFFSQNDIGKSTSKERQYGYFLTGNSPMSSPMSCRQNLPMPSSSRERQFTSYQPNSSSSLPQNEFYQDVQGRFSPQLCTPSRDQQIPPMRRSPKFMDHSTSPTFGACGYETNCTLVYQMTARFLNFNGMRLPGGVRVLLEVSQKEAYIQLLSPLKEVYVSFYVSSITFLNSTSAAGVAWSGLVCKDSKLPSCEYPANSTRAFHSVANMATINECGNKGRLVLVAQIVFTDPYQAHRFRIVLDTVKCAFSQCDNLAITTAGDLGSQTQGPPPFPTALVDPMTLNLQQQGYPSPRQRPQQRCASTMPVPPPPNAIGPFSESPHYHVDGGVNSLRPACPCTPEPLEEVGDGQEHGELFDPYAYEITEEKTLFCARACLAKLDVDGTWLEMQQGYCKVIQCANGLGFVIGFESKCCITQYYLRKDTVFERAPKTKYGFIYKVVQSNDGETEVNEYLMSFQNCEDATNFKTAVDRCHRALMMTADTGFDNTGRLGWSVCANNNNDNNNNCSQTRARNHYDHHSLDNVSPPLGGYSENNDFDEDDRLVSDCNANWNNSWEREEFSNKPEKLIQLGCVDLGSWVEFCNHHSHIRTENPFIFVNNSQGFICLLFWIILRNVACLNVNFD